MNLKNGKVYMSKFVGTGPSSYEKRIYQAAVSRKLRNTVLGHCNIFKHTLNEYKLFYVSFFQDVFLLHVPNPTQHFQPLGCRNSVQPICTYFMYVRSKIYPCLEDNRWCLYSKYQPQLLGKLTL